MPIVANHTSFKVKVLSELLFTDKSQYSIAVEFKINQSMISKWLKNKDVLFQQAAVSNKKRLLKNRPSRKYLQMHQTLLTTFKEARKKGHHVNFNWLWSQARIIYREQLENSNANIKKHVVVFEALQHRMRRRQRNKKQSKEYYREDLRK